MDRISQLPQPIQHYILTFLENKDIAQITPLSKQWRGIVESRPVLEFNQYQSRGRSKYSDSKSKDCLFMKHVGRSIRRIVKQNLNIQECNLEVYPDEIDRFESRDSRLNCWIKMLVKKAKVKVLCVKTCNYYYTLPPLLFLSETITDLRLVGCNVECSNVRMPNLLQLCLKDVSLTQGSLEKLVFLSQTITDLRLIQCKVECSNVRMPSLLQLTLNDVTIMEGTIEKISSGCPSLEIFELHFSDKCSPKVKVIAPKLRVFKCCHVDEFDLLACESTLRKLKLRYVIDITKERLRNLFSKLHELEVLVLEDMAVKSIEIPKKKIRKLKVICCSIERLEIDSPDLRVLKFERNKLPFYSLNSSFRPIDTIDFGVIFTAERTELGNEFRRWSDSFKELFIKFRRFIDMKLIVTLDKDVIVYEDELEENFTNMLCHVKDKSSIHIKVMRIKSYEDMANHLFLRYHTDKETVSIVSRIRRTNKKLLEVLSKKAPKENKERNCCKFQLNDFKPHKCWKHGLIDAKMIEGEIERPPDLFKSLDITEYEITRMKLQWDWYFS